MSAASLTDDAPGDDVNDASGLDVRVAQADSRPHNPTRKLERATCRKLSRVGASDQQIAEYHRRWSAAHERLRDPPHPDLECLATALAETVLPSSARPLIEERFGLDRGAISRGDIVPVRVSLHSWEASLTVFDRARQAYRSLSLRLVDDTDVRALASAFKVLEGWGSSSRLPSLSTTAGSSAPPTPASGAAAPPTAGAPSDTIAASGPMPGTYAVQNIADTPNPGQGPAEPSRSNVVAASADASRFASRKLRVGG